MMLASRVSFVCRYSFTETMRTKIPEFRTSIEEKSKKEITVFAAAALPTLHFIT